MAMTNVGRKFIITIVGMFMVLVMMMYGMIDNTLGFWTIVGLIGTYTGANVIDKKFGGKG